MVRPVAAPILKNLESFSYGTLAKISRDVSVSETTVIRLANTLGHLRLNVHAVYPYSECWRIICSQQIRIRTTWALIPLSPPTALKAC